MAAKHKYSGASVSVDSALDAHTLAKDAGTLQLMIRLEDSRPGLLTYSVRSRITGGRVEVMTFQLTLTGSGDRLKLASKIRSSKTSRQMIMGVIPGPKSLLGWKPHKRFIWDLARLVEAADSTARITVIEKVR